MIFRLALLLKQESCSIIHLVSIKTCDNDAEINEIKILIE